MTFPNALRASSLLEALGEVVERVDRIDHRREAARHLGERIGNVAHRASEGAEDAVLLLEQLHQVHGGGHARGRAAGDEAPAALEAQERAVPGVGADMLEHHVDAFALRELPDLAFEALGAGS